MATIPTPQPDYGPVDSPEPTVAPTEMPTMPGDIDQPDPGMPDMPTPAD